MDSSQSKYLDIVSNLEEIDTHDHLILSKKHKLIRKVNELILEISRSIKFSQSQLSDGENDDLFIFLNHTLFTLINILEFLQNNGDFTDILQELADANQEMANKIEILEPIKIINNSVPSTLFQIYLRKSSILSEKIAGMLLQQDSVKLAPHFIALSYLLLLFSY